jgi:hypothetical protein
MLRAILHTTCKHTTSICHTSLHLLACYQCGSHPGQSACSTSKDVLTRHLCCSYLDCVPAHLPHAHMSCGHPQPASVIVNQPVCSKRRAARLMSALWPRHAAHRLYVGTCGSLQAFMGASTHLNGSACDCFWAVAVLFKGLRSAASRELGGNHPAHVAALPASPFTPELICVQGVSKSEPT